MGLKSRYQIKMQQKYRARKKRQKLILKKGPAVTPAAATPVVAPPAAEGAASA